MNTSGSWKTSAAAIIGAIGMIIGEICDLLNVAVPALGTNGHFEINTVLAALGVLGIGYFARDKNVSSEQQAAADSK